MNHLEHTVLKNTNIALITIGYRTEAQRAIYLAAKMVSTYKTARAWVRLERFPRNWWKLIEVLKNRDINPDWLWGKKGQCMLLAKENDKMQGAINFLGWVKSQPGQGQAMIRKMVFLLSNPKTTDATMTILQRMKFSPAQRAYGFREIDKLWTRKHWGCIRGGVS